MHCFVPYSHFGVFPNFTYIDLWANFHLWVYHRIFYGSENFSSKSMEPHLSNALSNTFVALLVAEISSFQFQQHLSYHLCGAFSYGKLRNCFLKVCWLCFCVSVAVFSKIIIMKNYEIAFWKPVGYVFCVSVAVFCFCCFS